MASNFHWVRSELPTVPEVPQSLVGHGREAIVDITRVINWAPPAGVHGKESVEELGVTGVVLAWLAVAGVLVYVIITDWFCKRLQQRQGKHPTEKTALVEGRNKGCVPDGGDSEIPLQARIFSMVGSVVLLFLFTFLWWVTGHRVGVAVCAIGLSVRFCFCPVEFNAKFMCGGKVVFNMATMSWSIICWLLIFNVMPRRTVSNGLLGNPDTNLLPWTMLVTFISSIYICTTLETTGGLDCLSRFIMRSVGHSQNLIFLSLAALSAGLTILIPDDVVTFTLAPVVCCMSADYGLNAIPYLYVIFYNANIWAVILLTGNVTNTLVAASMKYKFIAFARVMVWPGVVAGSMAITLLWIAFTPKMKALFRFWEDHDTGIGGGKARTESLEISSPETGTNLEKDNVDERHPILFTRMWLCSVRFIGVFVFAAFDSLHNWPIWLSLAVFAVGSLVLDLILDLLRVDGTSKFTSEVITNLPYDVFFFFFALFVLVQELVRTGIVTAFANGLNPLASRPFAMMVSVGYMSLFLSQVLSSAPTTILILETLARVPAFDQSSNDAGSTAFLAKSCALWALVIGSNLCGNISRMGTMGGQMWVKIAQRHGIVLSDVPIFARGLTIMVPTMMVSMTVLYAVLNHRLTGAA